MASERRMLSFDPIAAMGNIGVPAVILLISVTQLSPKLDKWTESQARMEGALTVVASQCVPRSVEP